MLALLHVMCAAVCSGEGPTPGTAVAFTIVSSNAGSTAVAVATAGINSQTVASRFSVTPGVYTLTYVTDASHIDWPWVGFSATVVLETSTPPATYTLAPTIAPSFALWQAGAVPVSLSSVDTAYWLSSGAANGSAMVIALNATGATSAKLLVVTSAAVQSTDYLTAALTVTDVTAAAGFPAGVALSATAGDVDGDGDDDVILVTPSSLALLMHDGNGRYVDEGTARGLPPTSPSAAVSVLLDADGDGALDVLVVTARWTCWWWRRCRRPRCS